MLRVLLSGPAGSGKNTVAKMLLKEFDQFGYFSAGDVIRDHIQRGTEFGQRISSFVRKGELIPDSIINGVLLEEIRHAGNKLILNGYPRTLGQVRMIEEVAPLDLVVELRGKDDITGEPLFKREDDAAEVVGRRLEVHEKTESKVVDYYR
ncbi:adenylate kinase [Teladorsagia circumcincta]|uniref:Adenylate kinase n=1 Tax=Teladorsagia circumcincta TaxID=45464 RepID=A0A2G9TZN9_TELCI|nr:adenylate kinase [Teladorsagia circumcincta]